MAALFRVEERRDGRVGGADELAAGDAFGGFALAGLHEVEEDAVEGASGGDVAARCRPCGSRSAGAAFGEEWIGLVRGRLSVVWRDLCWSYLGNVLGAVKEEVEA